MNVNKSIISERVRQFFVYIIVFFACILLVLTALSFEDTKNVFTDSTKIYISGSATSIASVTEWSYIQELSRPGSEETPAYDRVLTVLKTTRERHPNIQKIVILTRTPSGYIYMVDSNWGTPDGHSSGSSYTGSPVLIDAAYSGVPDSALPFEKNDPISGSAPIRSSNGTVEAVVLIDSDSSQYFGYLERIATLQIVLLIILPALVLVTVLSSENVTIRLRKRIRKNEAEYNSVVESTKDAVSMLDRSGEYLFMNSRYIALLGIGKDDWAGKTYHDLHTPDDSLSFMSDLNHVFTSGTLQTKEIKSGRQYLLRILNPVIDPDSGSVIAVTNIIRDITSQKNTERSLIENEKRYRLLLLNASDAIVLFELKGSHPGKIVEVNELSGELLGYSCDELLAMTVRDFGITRSQEKFRDIYLELINTSHVVFETELLTKSGNLLPVEISARLFTFLDTPTVLASIRDISQRKASERELRNSLLEKQLLLKEIHHRVKNNLQVIISLLNLQSRYVDDPRILAIISESQHRVKAMALVHEQLYQTRRFAGINIRDYIPSLTGNLMNTFCRPNQKISMDISVDDIWIPIDIAIPLGLIISELVSNSMKYAFPDSSDGLIRIALTTKDDQCTLVISDDGVGMPENFDWERAHSLGLRLVRMLLKQIQGTLTLLPSDKGAVFRISFVLIKSNDNNGGEGSYSLAWDR